MRRKYVESNAPEMLCHTLNSSLGTAASGGKSPPAKASPRPEVRHLAHGAAGAVEDPRHGLARVAGAVVGVRRRGCAEGEFSVVEGRVRHGRDVIGDGRPTTPR